MKHCQVKILSLLFDSNSCKTRSFTLYVHYYWRKKEPTIFHLIVSMENKHPPAVKIYHDKHLGNVRHSVWKRSKNVASTSNNKMRIFDLAYITLYSYKSWDLRSIEEILDKLIIKVSFALTSLNQAFNHRWAGALAGEKRLVDHHFTQNYGE